MMPEQTPSRSHDERHSETVLATVRGVVERERIDSILACYGLRAESADGSDHIAVLSGNRHSEPEVDLDLVTLALAKLDHAHRDGSLSMFSVVASKVR